MKRSADFFQLDYFMLKHRYNYGYKKITYNKAHKTQYKKLHFVRGPTETFCMQMESFIPHVIPK